MGGQPVAKPLPTQTQNKRRHTSMPRVGFETTIPLVERATTVHALDRAAAVIARVTITYLHIYRKVITNLMFPHPFEKVEVEVSGHNIGISTLSAFVWIELGIYE
jgi:hypothetical protein